MPCSNTAPTRVPCALLAASVSPAPPRPARPQPLNTLITQGCAGISIQEARCTPQGLPFDRRWMIVDEKTGRFMSQRTHPKMALINVSLPPEVLSGKSDAETAPDAHLTMSAPGVPAEVRVPLTISGAPKLRTASVWAWSGVAQDEGDGAAALLSTYMGRPVRLVRYLGTVDPAADDAATTLAADAVMSGEGGPGGVKGARAALQRAVEPEFAPWGAEVAFAGEV